MVKLITKKSRIFPSFKEPRFLEVLDIRPYSWDEQITMVCIQGLVNRIKPRIYLIFDDYIDRLWLTIYNKRYGLKFKEAKHFNEIISSFSDQLNGYVVYDDKMLHSANVAMTYGSINNAVPAAPIIAEKFSELGLQKIADFRGKWRNRFEAYEWELDNLMPKCNKRIVGSMCVDPPCIVSNQGNRHHVRDYLVATKAFSFDLSTKIRDRKENDLFDKILRHISSLGVVLGWHCCRDLEIEAVARSAKNGLFVLCNLSSPNLTVHSGIKTNFDFKQKHVNKNDVIVENKVYVTFVQSDGDAIWAMHNFQNRNWLDSQRGNFPYTWELQPLFIDLGPGIMEYYYRTATPQDYFIAGPSGAGYTAPSINKYRKEFLDLTRRYLESSDLRSILVMNRNPRVCYQELPDIDMPSELIHNVGIWFGLLHGYVGSGFEPIVFVDSLPYVHTSLYVSASSDVLKEVKRFSEVCKTRPLFVSVHVREDTNMSTLRGIIDKLDHQVYKIVKIDEFMLTLQKAFKEGLFKEAFPEKEFFREALKEQGKIMWENHYKRIIQLEKLLNLEPDMMLKEYSIGGYDFTLDQLPDLIGYEVIDTMLRLVFSVLNLKGIYVNCLQKSVDDFLKEYSNLPDVNVVKIGYILWRDWEQVKFNLDETRILSNRIIRLAKILHEKLLQQ